MVNNVVKKDKTYDHVVIIGGGDLLIATYLLKNFPLVNKVTVCEIDARVIEVTKMFFSIADVIDKELEKGRLNIVIQSGKAYMEQMRKEG